ncbi:hypothetical protein HDE_11081 [Halotydeus destructor]|nr:hypothetical protein HDE_11081 [Halotydeus destructor]
MDCYSCQRHAFVALNILATALGFYFFISGCTESATGSSHDMATSLAMVGVIGASIGAFGFFAACFEAHRMLFIYAAILSFGFSVEVYFFVQMKLLMEKGVEMPQHEVNMTFLALLSTIELVLAILSITMAVAIKRERMYYDRYE